MPGWNHCSGTAPSHMMKIGGDKGGKTIKFNFHITNVNHPNSVKNSTVFAMFEAQDCYFNLKSAVQDLRI